MRANRHPVGVDTHGDGDGDGVHRQPIRPMAFEDGLGVDLRTARDIHGFSPYLISMDSMGIV